MISDKLRFIDNSHENVCLVKVFTEICTERGSQAFFVRGRVHKCSDNNNNNLELLKA